MTTKISKNTEANNALLAAEMAGKLGADAVGEATKASPEDFGGGVDLMVERLRKAIEESVELMAAKTPAQRGVILRVARDWPKYDLDTTRFGEAAKEAGMAPGTLRKTVKNLLAAISPSDGEPNVIDEDGYVRSLQGAVICHPTNIDNFIARTNEDFGHEAINVFTDVSTGKVRITFSPAFLAKMGWHDDREDCGVYNEARARFGRELTDTQANLFGEAALTLINASGWHGESIMSRLTARAARTEPRNCVPLLAADIGKRWDGVARIKDAYKNTFNRTPDGRVGGHDESVLEVKSRLSWMAQAARMVKPGCDLTTVDVLIDAARGGTGKSLYVKARAGVATRKVQDRSDTLTDLGKVFAGAGLFAAGALPARSDRDMFEKLSSRCVYENSEGVGLVGDYVSGEDIKARLTQGTTTCTAKHQNDIITHQATHTTFITTNSVSILSKIKGGLRRFSVIDFELSPDFKTEDGSLGFNLDWLIDNFEQLLAEGIRRVEAGERFTPTEREQDLIAAETQSHLQRSPVEEYLPVAVLASSDAGKTRKGSVVRVLVRTIDEHLRRTGLSDREYRKLSGFDEIYEFMAAQGMGQYRKMIRSRILGDGEGWEVPKEVWEAWALRVSASPLSAGFTDVRGEPRSTDETAQEDDFLAI